MDNDYDKEIGLRELVLQDLNDIVDDLQIQSEDNPKLIHSEESKYCILLTICLERSITFGMRERSRFFKQRDLFEFLSKGSVNNKDVYLRQDFQSVQQLLLKQSGKARAWIRKTINESHLATSLYALASDREFIRSWYEPYAIMATNTINDLATAAEKLEELHFNFNLRDRILDHDDLFSLPPSQYRGQHKLKRLRDDENSDDEDTEKKKKRRKKRDKGRSKKDKSRRKKSGNSNLSLHDAVSDEMDFEANKSLSPPSENGSIHKKERKKKRKKKRGGKKKRDSPKRESIGDDELSSPPALSTNNVDEVNDDQTVPDEEEENIEKTEESMDREMNPERVQRKKSFKEWQEERALSTPNMVPTDSAPMTRVNTMTAPSHPVTSTTTMSRSAPHAVLSTLPPSVNANNYQYGNGISERMSSKLSSIPIKIPGANGQHSHNGQPIANGAEKKVFRVSSPVDYHATFKWNDAAKDNVSAKLQRLYDDEHENKKVFPDEGTFEEKEQEFFDEMEAEVTLMDDSLLEQEIDTLIQNAPQEDGVDDDLLLMSSDDDGDEIAIHRSTSPQTVDAIPEHREDDRDRLESDHNINAMNSIDRMYGVNGDDTTLSTLQNANGDSNRNMNGSQMFYSPKEDKASTTASATSSGVSSASPFSGSNETTKTDVMTSSTNNTLNHDDTENEDVISSANNTVLHRSLPLHDDSEYHPECQTFIHFTASDQSALSDPTQNSLQMYLQSDSYFADENQQRDRRKKEQDDEAKRRRQREQDVMRGNDVSSIQKSLNSSGMAASGGSDNAPLDGTGNKVVLPSTGIILDATENKKTTDFFMEQQGQCFSCGDHLGSAQMARQCYYTQRLYCTLCMDGTVSSIIPSRIVHHLDTRKYPISAQSKQHLDSMFDVPAVPLSKMELPSWYIPTESANVTMLQSPKRKRQSINDDVNAKYCKLIKLGEYLEILSYLKQYFYGNKECPQINYTVQCALGRRPYLLDAYSTDKDTFGYLLQIIDKHRDDGAVDKGDGGKTSRHRLYGLISMRDMFELFNRDLLSTMQFAQSTITKHIKSCKQCKKRSYGANVEFIRKFAEILQ